MHGPMRQELPLSVAPRIHPLEPYDKCALFRIPSSVPRAVLSIGNRNVSVKLNFHRVQIAQLVRDFTNRRQPLRAILDAERSASGCPAIPVSEAEVARADLIQK